MTWQRSDDALIARVAEGLVVEQAPKATANSLEFFICREPGKPKWWRPLYDYTDDLLAGHRALEAWFHKNPEGTYRGAGISYRSWRPNGHYEVMITEEPISAGDEQERLWEGEAATLAEAIALALRAACEGKR